MSALACDIRYALRLFGKNLGVTVLSTLVLTFGIGGVTMMFSLVNAVRTRLLPYPHADRLVIVTQATNASQELSPTWLNFLDWKEQSHSFELMAVNCLEDFTVTGAADAERIQGQIVTSDFLPLFGAQTLLGRGFRKEDDATGATPTAILEYSFWRRRFASDPTIVGKPITLNNTIFTIVGVLPETFHYYQEGEIFLPIGAFPDRMGPRWNHQGLGVTARLAPGVDLAQARADMAVLGARLAQMYPDSNSGQTVLVIPFAARIGENIRVVLILLFGAVWFVLLIACAAVGNLQMARAASRQREISIRGALGAAPKDIIRQILTENLLLGVIGGGLGLLISWVGVRLIKVLLPPAVERVTDISFHSEVLLFALITSVFTSILFGLAPALFSSRSDLRTSLSNRSIKGSSGHRTGFRSFLVMFEIALTVVLMIGATLMIKTLFRLYRNDPGFVSDKVVTMQAFIPTSKYSDRSKILSFYTQLLSGIQRVPGVSSAGMGGCLPMNGICYQAVFQMEGQPVMQAREKLPRLDFNIVDPGYFRALRIALVQGRVFDEHDYQDSLPAAVISESTAKKFWPNENPLGKHLRQGGPEDKFPPREVVGVVRDVKREGLAIASPGEVYVPFAQFPVARTNIVVHAESPEAVVAGVRNVFRSVDREVPMFNVRTMDSIVTNSLSARRLNVLLLATFSLFAFLLSILGIYGVVSYSVTQRRHEIGIRIALGAPPRHAEKIIIGQGVKLVIVGVSAGIASAFVLTRFLAQFLFGVTALDSQTFVLVPLVIATAAALACYIPATRAAVIDPVVALRQE